jgi:hypothetical protein
VKIVSAELGAQDIGAGVDGEVLLEPVVHRHQHMIDEEVDVTLIGADVGRGLRHDLRARQREDDMDSRAAHGLARGRLDDGDDRG